MQAAGATGAVTSAAPWLRAELLYFIPLAGVMGAAMGAGTGTVRVSSNFLPQALKATSAASAIGVVAMVLNRVVNMRFSFEVKGIEKAWWQVASGLSPENNLSFTHVFPIRLRRRGL